MAEMDVDIENSSMMLFEQEELEQDLRVDCLESGCYMPIFWVNVVVQFFVSIELLVGFTALRELNEIPMNWGECDILALLQNWRGWTLFMWIECGSEFVVALVNLGIFVTICLDYKEKALIHHGYRKVLWIFFGIFYVLTLSALVVGIAFFILVNVEFYPCEDSQILLEGTSAETWWDETLLDITLFYNNLVLWVIFLLVVVSGGALCWCYRSRAKRKLINDWKEKKGYTPGKHKHGKSKKNYSAV